MFKCTMRKPLSLISWHDEALLTYKWQHIEYHEDSYCHHTYLPSCYADVLVHAYKKLNNKVIIRNIPVKFVHISNKPKFQLWFELTKCALVVWRVLIKLLTFWLGDWQIYWGSSLHNWCKFINLIHNHHLPTHLEDSFLNLNKYLFSSHLKITITHEKSEGSSRKLSIIAIYSCQMDKQNNGTCRNSGGTHYMHIWISPWQNFFPECQGPWSLLFYVELNC